MIERITRTILLGALALFATSCGGKPTSPVTLDPYWGSFTIGKLVITTIHGYRNDRALFVYLPHGFDRTTRTYPVLLVLDGQAAFGGPNTFHLDHVIDSLTAVGTIPPTIVVGVASAPGGQRFGEYIPYDGGEQFLAGVRDTLLPELRLRFRVTSSADSTSLLGSSLGGLMAAYVAFAHDETFRRVAGLSVSYGFAGFGGATFRQTMREEGRGNVDRFYQDTGDGDDNGFDNLQLVEALARDSLGFVPGCDIKTVLAHGDHDYISWSRRMPSIVAYLLGPPDPGCATSARQLPR